MDAKPSHVMRHGKAPRCGRAIGAVKSGRSRGGGVMRQYRRADGSVDAAPAQAGGRQPPRHRLPLAVAQPQGFNIMLDVGADIRADEHDLTCNTR